MILDVVHWSLTISLIVWLVFHEWRHESYEALIKAIVHRLGSGPNLEIEPLVKRDD